MTNKWFKMIGAAVVVGALGVVAFGAVAFAQDPTPTPNSTNPTQPSQKAPGAWFGFGHGMRGFGMHDGFGKGGGHGFDNPGAQNSLFTVAAKALGITSAELLTQLQQGKSIADLAKEKNVDPAKIISDALAAHQTALQTAVTNKQITQAQADAMLALHKANLEAKMTYKFDASSFAPRGSSLGMRGAGSFLVVAAKAFDLAPADLMTQLQQGKTLADIAKEKNVDTAKLVSDYVAAFAEKLKTAVTNNQLTQAQADAMVAQYKANAEALLTKKFDTTNFGGRGFGMFGHGERGGRGGMRGGMHGWGQQPQQQQTAPGTQQSN